MLRHGPVPLSDRAGPYSRSLWPLAFEAVIWVPPYPWHFWPPMHISKYDGKTNLDHWLGDYCLTMNARVSDDDFAV
jgi:hypothetical protein